LEQHKNREHADTESNQGSLEKPTEKPAEEIDAANDLVEIEPVAMCYEMAFPEESYEYLCPVCAEKTVYELDAVPTEENDNLSESFDQVMDDVDNLWQESGAKEQTPLLTRAEIGQNLKILLRQTQSKTQRPGGDGGIPPSAFLHHPTPPSVLAELLTHSLVTMRREIDTIRGLELHLDERQFCKNCSPNVAHPHVVLVVTFEKEGKKVRTDKFNQADLTLIHAFSTFCLGGMNQAIPPSLTTRDACLRLVEIFGFKVAKRQ